MTSSLCALGIRFVLLALACSTPLTGAEKNITRIELDATARGTVISPLLFGHNLEVTRRAVWTGISAEMLANRKFAAHANGLPKQWKPISTNTTVVLDQENAYAGKTGLRITVNDAEPGGIFQQQESLSFRANERYAFRWWLKTDARLQVRMRLVDPKNSNVLFETEHDMKPGGWQLWSGKFKLTAKTSNARVELSCPGHGSFWVGAASIQPTNTFHGMRWDVIEELRKLKPGSLRFPGGCYAEFYHWEDGLLPVDQRPPIGPTGLDFLLRNSDDVDNQELGIDEFIALCRELKCEPALTIRLSESTPENAAAWVEYCNGGVETMRGKTRAQRGHPQPYRVKTWFLGNELYFFGRGGLNQPDQCARQSALFAKSVKKVDPSILLIGCTNLVGGNNQRAWNQPLLAAVGETLDGISFHDYMQDSHKPPNLRAWATASTVYLRPALQRIKQELGKQVLFDEWNTKWGESGSLGMGLYAAGVLQLLCREAEPLNVMQSHYFQPITEGGIRVTPWAAELDEAGKVFALLSTHQENHRLTTPETASDADLDICGSITSDGGQAYVSVINRSVSREHALEVCLKNFKSAEKATLTFLSPSALEVQGSFIPRDEIIPVDDNATVRLNLAPCTVLRANFSAKP